MKKIMKDSYLAPGNFAINAYSDEASLLKEQFLSDGIRYANSLRKQLPASWSIKAHKNKGGIAVSGEVYIDVVPLEGNYQLLVEIGSTSMRGGLMNERDDGVLIIVQVRRKATRSIIEHNRYFHINTDPVELAQELVQIYAKNRP